MPRAFSSVNSDRAFENLSCVLYPPTFQCFELHVIVDGTSYNGFGGLCENRRKAQHTKPLRFRKRIFKVATGQLIVSLFLLDTRSRAGKPCDFDDGDMSSVFTEFDLVRLVTEV